MPQSNDIIVIGASAGGLDALVKLVPHLTIDLKAAVFIVVHLSPGAESNLPAILSRTGPLPATHAIDGEPIRQGHIYIAPPDRHLMLSDGRMQLVDGPQENRHRPAIDALFRSAAKSHGDRVIGVLLSGALDDGVAGLAEIKLAGGLVVVQDPDDAMVASMPRNAIAQVSVDHVATAGALAPLLVRLVEASERDDGHRRGAPADGKNVAQGRATTYACPDCGGVLVETPASNVLRYTCRVGHAMSAETLLAAQADALEEALWAAVRTLDERAELSTRFAIHARERGHTVMVAHFEQRATEARDRASIVRRALAGSNS
jgi:two-component system chemotaxis response regulator CheB